MRRRELIIALGFAIVWPIAANGQQDNRALRGQILLMQAECIADKLAEFIKQVRNQVDWTTQLPSTGGLPQPFSDAELPFPMSRPPMRFCVITA